MERFSIKSLLDIKDYKGTNIVLAFTLLRFIATCLITNTHYNDVYPITAFAVGGLLGDVLFFIVSGFVLAKPMKQGFLPWYGKRILRIYPTIITGVTLYIITGYQDLKGISIFEAFVFPTFFVFVAAIIILYVPYYFINKVKSKKTYLIIGGVWLILWIIMYVFFLDKSKYRMNQVTHPMILFPYFTAMLIGGYIKKFGVKKYGAVQITLYVILSLLSCIVYFVTNNLIRGDFIYYNLQILVPFTLLIASSCISIMFYLSEDWFHKWPCCIITIVNFIAALTLEIYVVQKPIIDALSYIVFPFNWLLITACILGAAVFIRLIVNFIKALILTVIEKGKYRKM